MRLRDTLALTLRRLRHRPVRSFLLLQGTIWGVAVAVFPSAVLDGTRAAVLSRGPEVGADRITFVADPTAAESRPLERGDAAVAARAAEAAGARVVAAAGITVKTGLTAGGTRSPVPYDLVLGDPEAPVARGLSYAEGRPFDPDAAEPEAVVEGLLAARLATERGKVLGSALDLGGGRVARIVGVLAPRTDRQRRTNDMGYDTGHPMYRSVVGNLLVMLGVPVLDDDWKRTDGCAYAAPAPADRADGAPVEWIYLRVPTESVRAAAKAGQEALLARGRSPLRLYPFLYSMLVADELERFKAVDAALFLACLAMGGVVMANLGLLAAMRRSGEIAIHRVEGATRRDVAAQFLAEGGILAVVGVALGLPLALGLAAIRVHFEPMAGFTWVIPWGHVALVGAVAVAIGVLSSTLPAIRAASVEPAEGLVDE